MRGLVLQPRLDIDARRSSKEAASNAPHSSNKLLVACGRSDKKYARDDVGASQSCAKPAALARFRVIVGRAAASGARPETLLEGAREVFVARLAAAAF